MATAIALILVGRQANGGERFTEFYLLGPDGIAEGPPSALTVGEEASRTLGVVNQEGEEATYDVALFINGTLVEQITDIRLKPGRRWQQPLRFTLTRAGEGQLVEFVLYKDRLRQPYRTLHLWVDGQEAVAALETAPTPATAGQEAPPREGRLKPAEPRYEIHIVSSGENLTFISERHGVPLEAVIEANASEIPNPNLIYPNQRIRIPVEAR
jgi:hypothetical protein